MTSTQGKRQRFVMGFRVKAVAWALAELRISHVWIPRGGYVYAPAVVVFP